MVLISNIAEDKKMSVIFRVESGSLGPNGRQYIDEFCHFAQQQLQGHAKAYITWSIVPRFDKTLAEIEFQIASKKLPRSKAAQYLKIFGESLDHFEAQLEDNIEAIINQYLGR